MTDGLRYVTNIHGMTGEEDILIRVHPDFAVLQIGPVCIFAESVEAIWAFSAGLDLALEQFSAEWEKSVADAH